MISKTRGLVLRNIDYSDSSIITRIFTEKFGMQSYLVRGAKGKKAAIRPSQLMPMTLLELVVYNKPGTTLQSIKELKCVPMLQRMHFEIPRSSVALFCAEILLRCLPDEDHPEEELFDFLFHFVQTIDDAHEELPYLPIYFCLQLASFLGFTPKENFSAESRYFDVTAGEFSSRPGLTYLDEVLSSKLSEMLHMEVRKLPSLKINRESRAALLDAMVRYLELHLPGSGRIKSHLILKEVFD